MSATQVEGGSSWYDGRMGASRLVLENFRCFERLELDLHPECTVLVGANGAGKTAVVEALALCIFRWLGLGLGKGWTPDIEDRDRRRVGGAVSGVPSWELAGPTSLQLWSGPWPGSTVVTAPHIRVPSGFFPPNEGLESIGWHRLQSALSGREATTLPVFAYYGANRAVPAQPFDVLRDRSPIESVLHAYDGAKEADTDVDGLTQWLTWREHVRLQAVERRIRVGEAPQVVVDIPLQAVSSAVCSCLDGAVGFGWSASDNDVRVQFRNGTSVPVSALSAGQRSIAMLVADVARRAARLNPHLGAGVCDTVDGIVLIDEVDLHLHPAWQRRVLADLRRVFPKVQFVATTHSPQVLSSCDPAWVRILKDDGSVTGIDHTRGRDSNALLEDVFGVSERPEAAREKIHEIALDIHAERYAEALAKLDALEADLGPNDPDIVRSRTTIELEQSFEGKGRG